MGRASNRLLSGSQIKDLQTRAREILGQQLAGPAAPSPSALTQARAVLTQVNHIEAAGLKVEYRRRQGNLKGR